MHQTAIGDLGILPAPMLSSNRRYANPAQTPHRPTLHPLYSRPTTRGSYPEADHGLGRIATQKFSLSPQPEVRKGLISTREIPSTRGNCDTKSPAPGRRQSRRPVAIASNGFPGSVMHPVQQTPVTYPPPSFWYICLDSKNCIH